MEAVSIPIKYANKVVGKYHRHNKPTAGGLFAIGAVGKDATLQGVAIVGRPVARLLDDGYTAEVLRVCTIPNAQKGTNSFLYARCWRAWQAMGGRWMITYTLQSESGASLRGAGWRRTEASEPHEWTTKSRKRDHQKVYALEKYRWEKGEQVNGLPHPREYRLFRTQELQAELLPPPIPMTEKGGIS